MKTVFIRAFTSVVTRCFGWGLPKTMMVPFADCINHHNVDSTYELIHPVYHLAEKGDPDRGPEDYYSKTKMDIDYNDLLFPTETEEGNKKRKEWPNRTLNMIKKFLKRK